MKILKSTLKAKERYYLGHQIFRIIIGELVFAFQMIHQILKSTQTQDNRDYYSEIREIERFNNIIYIRGNKC